MTKAVLDQYSALQSCQIHITYNFQSCRITEKQANEVNFATIRAGANTCFPLDITKEPCMHCKTKRPNAEAHPPFALGRDVHFCHSILQHVNICPGRSPARAGLVVPAASCFKIHACRLCFLLHNPALTLTEQPAPAGPSVAHIHLFTDFICTSQQQTFIHHGNVSYRGCHYKHSEQSHGG